MRNTVIALFLIVIPAFIPPVYPAFAPIKSTIAVGDGTTCRAPTGVKYGVWKLDPSQCPNAGACLVENTLTFRFGTRLIASCNYGFQINATLDVYCIGNYWYSPNPSLKCEEIRCKNLNSASIDADCKYPGSDNVTCDSPRPGTVATLKCRDSYRVDITLPMSTSVACNDTGQWVPEPMRCVPATTSCTNATYGPTCIAPPYLQNGIWELDQRQCPSPEHCYVGRQFRPGTHLIYSCNSGFKINGSAHVFCGVDGQWSNDNPVCEEIRCKDLNSASIVAKCNYPGSGYMTCGSPRPGTVATLKCRDSYRVDKTLPLSTSVTCNDIGQWVPEPLRCVPVCGIVSTQTTPLIVSGTAANIVQFPWHSTLYKAENPNDKKEFQCGGTIIQERLVITAAHCINDDPSKYFVATGNIYRDYDSPFHDSSMVVKNIYVPSDYNGIHGFFKADIAILEVTEPFVFSASLQPICLDPYNNILLGPQMFGRVAGFGRTASGENSSYILQKMEAPYISRSDCKEAGIAYESLNYITHDKFCAGYMNGPAVCKGDSGGGLVFRRDSLWYLKGIVSVSLEPVGVNRTTQCNTYTLYTEVYIHMTWIMNYIQHEINKK